MAANFIKMTNVVQKIQQFKLQSFLFQMSMQSRHEYSVITNLRVSLGKILYLWNCSRFFHQIYSLYR